MTKNELTPPHALARGRPQAGNWQPGGTAWEEPTEFKIFRQLPELPSKLSAIPLRTAYGVPTGAPGRYFRIHDFAQHTAYCDQAS